MKNASEIFWTWPKEAISSKRIGLFLLFFGVFLLPWGSINMKRIEILFSGYVQGVGFRFTADRLSCSFDVAGTIQNLDSGQVKLVVEGKVAEVERFVTAICETTHGNVSHLEKSISNANGDLVGFEIIR